MNQANSWIFADFGTTLKAFALFSFFMVAPGFVAGWLTDASGFRKGSALRQFALAVPLSIAVLPILIYLPWRLLSIRAVWVVLATLAATFLVILAIELFDASRCPGAFRWQRRTAWIVGLTAIAIWLLIALGSLLDLRIGNRLYFSYTAFDYLSRIPIANSISHQDKLPAATPFLTLHDPVPLRYHYFWPMVCGLVTVAGRGAFTAREATTAGALWSGIALICLIAVYLRIFLGVEASRWRPFAIGLALLSVTGLDILPVLQWDYQHLHTPSLIYPTIEWWNEQVTAWMDAMLWVPHHLAALAACLVAFLLLWRDSESDTEEQPRKWPRPATIVLAAMALASAVGMSVFVTFTGASILVVWASLEFIWRRPKALAAVAAAGVLSLLMALPFLLELRSSTPVAGGISWQVRKFSLLADKLAPLGLTSKEQTWKTTFNRLALLPLNYFLELGVYFYAGILYCIRLWRTRPIGSRDRAALAMLGVSVVICTFLASDTADSLNDLGWRGFMPAQFILLLWTTELLDTRVPEQRIGKVDSAVLAVLLAIGLCGTLLDLTSLRAFHPFADSHLFSELAGTPYAGHPIGERSAALVDTYGWIRAHTPVNAVVEPNPDDMAYFYGLYAERPGMAIAGECDAYTGRTAECATSKLVVRPLFSGFGSIDDFPAACRSFPLDIVVVTNTDRVWRLQESWMRHYQPVYSTKFTKVFACRPSTLLR
jgi:hypothetical protein